MGAHGLPSLSLQEVLVPTLIGQKLQKRTSEPSNYFRHARFHKALGSSWGKVLPVSSRLNFRLTHLALEEVAVELQPNFPILGGSQKNQPALSGLWATEGNILCQALVPRTLRTALGFNSLLSMGTQNSCRS